VNMCARDWASRAVRTPRRGLKSEVTLFVMILRFAVDHLVCLLPICLSVCEPHFLTSTNFRSHYLWPFFGPSVAAVPYVMCFEFCGLRHYQPRSRGDNTFGSVHVCACVSVRLSVGALLLEPFDLDFWHEGRPWPWLAWDCRSKKGHCKTVCVCLFSPVWTSGAEQVDIRTWLAEFSQW